MKGEVTKGRYQLIFLLFLSLTGSTVLAQEKISGHFQDVSLTRLLTDIESQTQYHFFFDQRQTDSLQVNIEADNESLTAVLEKAFKDNDFHFAEGEDDKVFITRQHELRTELPVGFFDKRPEATFDATVFDFLNNPRNPGEKAETEKVREIGTKSKSVKGGTAVLSGHVRNNVTGEFIPGAAIYHAASGTGAVADPLGFYSLKLPIGRNQLRISFVGMDEVLLPVMLYSSGTLDIEMKENVIRLSEVVVQSERTTNVTGTQMGVEKIDAKLLKQIPVGIGEPDIMRVILTLPGVQSVGENSTGLNVRGGATSQNLILFDDATIYNSSHLFGFFSAFNPDILKNAELYKSGIPAEYGGRLSSVLEVNSKEGNKKKFSGSGGLGLITSRLTLEVPLIKNKMSVMIGGRSTYSDWLLSRIPNKAIRNSEGSFYDLNMLVSYDLNEKNNIYLSGYISGDRFKLNSDTTYQYGNTTATLKWKHVFNSKLYAILTGSYSGYHYEVNSAKNPVNAFDLSYGINQGNVKADFSYFANSKNTIYGGIGSIYYSLSPGTMKPLDSQSLVSNDVLQQEQATESSVYIGDRYDISPRLSVYAGLRYSFYNYLGPHTQYIYSDGVSKTEVSIVDTVRHTGSSPIATYQGPEFRFSGRYVLNENSSLKIGYQRMRQYIQMISNTTVISPTDIWKLSDPYIKPQIGDQISLGYYHNFKSNTIETSVEAYYKDMQNFPDYKGGALLLMNHHLETDLISTQGRAYGIEFMVKKSTGKLNGWVTYTYSRSLLKTNATQNVETVNGNKEYPSNFDKPHNFSLIGNYRFSRRISSSLNFIYSTGRPITLPVAEYELNGASKLFYSDRNQYRIPDYYRVDISLNLEGNHRIRKLAHSSWSLSIYNLTGRMNPYSVYFKSVNGVVKGYQLSIFGEPIPTITYNFKF